MKFQELKGACIASSVYAKGEQIGYNIPIKLPEVTPVIVEIQAAGGKLELPVWQQVEAMEASITKTGVSKEFLESLTPEPFDLISNVAQQSVSADGTSTAQHIKAFMRVIPKSAPGVEKPAKTNFRLLSSPISFTWTETSIWTLMSSKACAGSTAKTTLKASAACFNINN